MDTNQCAVCFSPMTELNSGAYYECVHQSCNMCSINWDRSKICQMQAPTCPLCRAPAKIKQFLIVKTDTCHFVFSDDQTVGFYDKTGGTDIEVFAPFFSKQNCTQINKNTYCCMMPQNAQSLCALIQRLFTDKTIDVLLFNMDTTLEFLARYNGKIDTSEGQLCVLYLLFAQFLYVNFDTEKQDYAEIKRIRHLLSEEYDSSDTKDIVKMIDNTIVAVDASMLNETYT